LAVALVVALVHLATRASGAKRLWAARVLVALVALGGLFFAFRSELAKVPFEPVARIASISTADGDVASRLFVWKNMLTEIKKSPWIGVGAEHIDALFNRFYDPTQIAEQWFDRSHNAFFDYTAQYGVGGLLLYLALIISFFTTAARAARRIDRPVAGFFALLAVTYAVQNFFVFDTISSFWLLLALLAALLSVSEEGPREAATVSPVMRRASWPVAAALLLLVVPFAARPALAAYDLAQAYHYQIVDVERETSYLSHGIALNTYGDIEYGYEAYDMYANTQVAVLVGQQRIDAYQAARALLTANFNRYAYDGRTALYLAHVLSLAPEGVTVDQALLSSALERAIRLSPKRAQPWYVLVNLSISNANAYLPRSEGRAAGYAAARDLLSRYIALVPRSAMPHYVLAQLLYASGETKGADIEAAKGKELYTSDLETARRAATYYETVMNLPDAAFFLAEVIELDPTNTAAKGDLEKIQAYEQSRK
ncbi:MAG: O-antigen ligase family protein, partial [Candidatus Paceibacterota bacterium]